MNDLPGATGQCTAGRDCYAVKIRLENLADGGNQSNNTALVGQTVKLYVKSGTDPEVFAANYVITGRGTIQNLDLTATSVVQGDIDGDGDVDAADRSLFIAVLLGIDTDPSHIARSDLDISGGVNGRDIQAFVTATIP